MRRKQPMFLLEILIALSLVTFCIFPFVRQPMQLHKAEMNRLEKVEFDRIAAWTFTELREKFLKKEFLWEQIPPLQRKSIAFSLPDVKLKLPPLPAPGVFRTVQFSTMEEKQELDGRIHRLVSVKIEVGSSSKNKRKFTYRLILTKYPVV